MPALPVSVMEPLRTQFGVRLPSHPEVDPDHPLSRHCRRIPDRIVLEHVVDALVRGSRLAVAPRPMLRLLQRSS